MSSSDPTPQEVEHAAAQGMTLAYWARHIPHERALISPRGDRSFAELNDNANRLARALRARGLRAGDSIALLCGNGPAFAEVVAAALRAGLRYTPVNWHLTADEAGYVIDDCDARALVVDARFGAVAADAVKRAPRVVMRLSAAGNTEGFESYEDVLAAEEASDLEDPRLGQRMLYTSGTTGRPKGVVRPPAYVVGRTPTLLAAEYEPSAGQLHLCTGPLYHAAPLAFSLLVPLVHGVGVVLMERWDAEEALQLIDRYHITHTHMVPTMFHRLLRLPEEVRARYDVSSMRYIVHGAAPCPVATKRAIMEWFGPIVWEYYAATEGSGSSVGPQEWLRKPGTVGIPPSPDHVLILGEDGKPCGPHQPGTVYMKPLDGASFHYHKDPGKTQRAHFGEHFTLGDIGYLDEEGYLFLTDRSADLIISGGVNIYPAEVEAALLQHPLVHDAAVIGVPNEEWGEEVKAVVEAKSEAQADAALASELIAFCREQLAHYKCPRSVEFTAALPRHDNGKLYKRRLREQYRKSS